MGTVMSETVQPDLAPTTAANYALFTRLYISPDLGQRRLDRPTVRDVQLWMNELKTRCQCCHQGKTAGGRKPSAAAALWVRAATRWPRSGRGTRPGPCCRAR